jgi:hypothetical protein
MGDLRARRDAEEPADLRVCGDDGTRTRGPLLANSTGPNGLPTREFAARGRAWWAILECGGSPRTRGVGAGRRGTGPGRPGAAGDARAEGRAAPGHVRALGAPAAGVRAAISQPVLRWGSTGTAVITLQQGLATLHYDVGAIDGTFGSDTYHAVVCFQKVNGLSRDGVVGSQTWAALYHPVVPVARHYTSGYGLEINLSRQVTKLIYRGQSPGCLTPRPARRAPRRRSAASMCTAGSTARGRARSVSCGGRTTSSVATPSMVRRRCRRTRPVTAASGSRSQA